MKLLALSFALLACVSLSAQDHWVCGDGKCQTAAAPLPEGAPILVTLTANRIEGENVLRLSGSVEIRTGALVLQADDAEYQWATGNIEARGSVRIKPTAPPSEGSRLGRTDFRTIGNVTSAAPSPATGAKLVRQIAQTPNATLSAASLTPEGDVFYLKGGVQIRTDAISVAAEEATYHQPSGEIEAAGEVHVKPMPLVTPGLRQFGVK